MEHDFIVRITPKEMQELFRGEKYNIRGYEFLGIKEKGDFDPRKHPASEHDTFYVTPCLYRIRLRKELTSYLSGRYKSWKHVEEAMKRKAFVQPRTSKYKVSVTVTLMDTVVVDAENLQTAEDIVRKDFFDGKLNIKPDSENMHGARFYATIVPKNISA